MGILGGILIFYSKRKWKIFFPPKKTVFRFLRIRENSKYKQEIRFRINMAKAAYNRKTTVFTCKLNLNIREKPVKCYIWSTALYGAENWTSRKVYKKYLERFKTWFWRRMEKISRPDRVRNDEVLHGVKKREISYTQ